MRHGFVFALRGPWYFGGCVAKENQKERHHFGSTLNFEMLAASSTVVAKRGELNN